MIKILLMEDDLDLCQSIQQALKKEGYSVDCCNDGESSMIYALNTDYGYDLAIVDRMLPSEIKEPQTQNSLKVIDAECIRMSRLVRDMLLLASSDADKWTIHTQEVNIDTLLIMLYEAYEPICRKKSSSSTPAARSAQRCACSKGGNTW